MSERWSEWIEHDGARPTLKGTHEIEVRYDSANGTIKGSDFESSISRQFPGFYWRWKWRRVGLLRQKKMRICDDPECMAIVEYRYRKPPASQAMRQLEQIVATPSAVEIVDPQKTEKVDEHRDQD